MKVVSIPTYDLTPSDRALIAEARHCFRVDFRYAEAVLWAHRDALGQRARIERQKAERHRIQAERRVMLDRLRAIEPRLARYVTLDASGCWVWVGATTGSGLPELKVRGKPEPVRRLIWRRDRGLPAVHQVRARGECQRACVHPDHLRMTDGSRRKGGGPGSAGGTPRGPNPV